MTFQQACDVRAAARASTSLDAPVGDSEDAVLGDLVASSGPLPDELVENSLRSQLIAVALSSLPERYRIVLVVLRYGLDDADPKTLEEIGRPARADPRARAADRGRGAEAARQRARDGSRRVQRLSG